MHDRIEPLPESLGRWWAAGPGDVVVEVREELTCWVVGTLEERWTGPHECRPVVHPRAVVDRLARPDGPDPEQALAEAIARAERARRRSIRPCVECGERLPPEHGSRLERGFTCHGCMSSVHGVVF